MAIGTRAAILELDDESWEARRRDRSLLADLAEILDAPARHLDHAFEDRALPRIILQADLFGDAHAVAYARMMRAAIAARRRELHEMDLAALGRRPDGTQFA